MFCIKCGAKVSESAAFCGKCGHKMNNAPKNEYTGQTPDNNSEMNTADFPKIPAAKNSDVKYNAEPRNGKKAKKPFIFKPVYAIIAAALIVVLAGAFFGGRTLLDSLDYRGMLSDAGSAVSGGEYERAVDLYREALDERPDDTYAGDMLNKTQEEALTQGLADAKELVSDGKIDDAIEVLSGLPISVGDEKYEEYRSYLNALKSSPAVASIDVSAFPDVTVYINTSAEMPANGILITDGGKAVPPENVRESSDGTQIVYTAEDSPDGGEQRNVSIACTIGEFTFPLSGSYVTPVFQDAAVTLVSTDFSDYPTVHAFFRVEDPVTKQPVENILSSSFAIKERVSGGAYVAREVKSAELMRVAGEKYGVNIALVADKSDSIGSDLSKIKTVMREFIGSLALAGRDRAELIAFDDVPQLMCTFTNDASLLNNGISNMETDGMTAFYDAVYQGIRNAALQGGARCVIAFTDGEDNRSRFTSGDVVRFANAKQVPLYIIGVGNSLSQSQNTLRSMARETKGHYWYIDDLYDLKMIYAQIYGELQNLYVVSYESDESFDILAQRGLQASMCGGGYKGTVDAEFSPSKTASDNSGGSRYEIFLEDVSWEEANERCLERGGHLVTITSKAEEDQIIALAESKGAQYVWLGGYTSYDSYNDVFGHWITGEDFSYQNWMAGEPSRHDKDGTPEWYLMLWNVAVAGGWTWNDQRNDLVAQFPAYKGKLAYVCEYE